MVEVTQEPDLVPGDVVAVAGGGGCWGLHQLHLLEAVGEPLDPGPLRAAAANTRLLLPDELPVHGQPQLLRQAAVVPGDGPQHGHAALRRLLGAAGRGAVPGSVHRVETLFLSRWLRFCCLGWLLSLLFDILATNDIIGLVNSVRNFITGPSP